MPIQPNSVGNMLKGMRIKLCSIKVLRVDSKPSMTVQKMISLIKCSAYFFPVSRNEVIN